VEERRTHCPRCAEPATRLVRGRPDPEYLQDLERTGIDYELGGLMGLRNPLSGGAALVGTNGAKTDLTSCDRGRARDCGATLSSATNFACTGFSEVRRCEEQGTTTPNKRAGRLDPALFVAF
jgi:hypothetical protein